MLFRSNGGKTRVEGQAEEAEREAAEAVRRAHSAEERARVADMSANAYAVCFSSCEPAWLTACSVHTFECYSALCVC